MNLPGNIEQRLEDLKKQLKDGNPDFKSFEDFYHELQKIQKEFQELLQWASEEQRGKDERFCTLYSRVAGQNASKLIESLRKTGFALRKKKELQESFDQLGYRILELVRAGKKDETFYAMLRIFVASKEIFPQQLVEAFKPIYPQELFKAFLFSFLSGILVKKETEEATQETI